MREDRFRRPPVALLTEDDRIGLRPLRIEDADPHFAGCDSQIIVNLGGGVRSRRAQVEAWLSSNAQAWADGSDVVDLGIVELQSDRLVGCVGVQRGLGYLTDGQVNVTYALYPPWRGHGYATRAVQLAITIRWFNDLDGSS
jgi:RimJ/RimL family protein N-acetyltransferase